MWDAISLLQEGNAGAARVSCILCVRLWDTVGHSVTCHGGGCSGHPAFPTPSVSRAERFWQSPGRVAPRGADACLQSGDVFARSPCDEAIQLSFWWRRWIASSQGLLAMTLRQPLDASWLSRTRPSYVSD